MNVRRPRPAWLLPGGALLAWVLTYVLAFSPPPGQPSLPVLYCSTASPMWPSLRWGD